MRQVAESLTQIAPGRALREQGPNPNGTEAGKEEETPWLSPVTSTWPE